MKLNLFICLKLFCIGVAFLQVNEARAEAFEFENVVKMAQKNAQVPYQNRALSLPPQLAHLTPEQYSDIRFKRERGAWFGQNLPFEIQLYHPGGLFNHSVQIYEIVDDEVKLIPYDSDDFDFGKNPVSEHILNEKLGYAGFRLHYPLNRNDYFDELISFLGASYFRALAKGQNYGLSARGLAINTAENVVEEFPVFTKFWLKRPDKDAKNIKMWALLDSESVTGAYQFDIAPKNDETSIRVNAVLFARKDIAKLGVAPLTSMFLYGENTKSAFDDYRPEVHDSDGLLVINGNGEKIWRPLDNSKHLRLIEPLENWGKGKVQLAELPSISETNDNVVAYWVPDEPIKAGGTYRFNYILHWQDEDTLMPELAKITATHSGKGGDGLEGEYLANKRKFVIDFSGFGDMNLEEEIKNGNIWADISNRAGVVSNVRLLYTPAIHGASLYFDFEPNTDITELRLLLRNKAENNRVISEVWSYQLWQ